MNNEGRSLEEIQNEKVGTNKKAVKDYIVSRGGSEEVSPHNDNHIGLQKR